MSALVCPSIPIHRGAEQSSPLFRRPGIIERSPQSVVNLQTIPLPSPVMRFPHSSIPLHPPALNPSSPRTLQRGRAYFISFHKIGESIGFPPCSLPRPPFFVFWRFRGEARECGFEIIDRGRKAGFSPLWCVSDVKEGRSGADVVSMDSPGLHGMESRDKGNERATRPVTRFDGIPLVFPRISKQKRSSERWARAYRLPNETDAWFRWVRA